MKNLFLIGLLVTVFWSCSNDDGISDALPAIKIYAFDFKKTDGTSFVLEDVKKCYLYVEYNNDTLFFNPVWSSFSLLYSDEIIQIDNQPPLKDYLTFSSIYPYYVEELETGSEWVMTTAYQFKYEDTEQFDEFIIKHFGKFLPNSRDIEYWNQEFYLNSEIIEAIELTYGYFFQIQK